MNMFASAKTNPCSTRLGEEILSHSFKSPRLIAKERTDVQQHWVGELGLENVDDVGRCVDSIQSSLDSLI